MAYIKKIKEGTETIYPATIPQAVVDPTSGKSVRTELDEKATSAELAQLAGEVDDSISLVSSSFNSSIFLSEGFNMISAIQINFLAKKIVLKNIYNRVVASPLNSQIVTFSVTMPNNEVVTFLYTSPPIGGDAVSGIEQHEIIQGDKKLKFTVNWDKVISDTTLREVDLNRVSIYPEDVHFLKENLIGKDKISNQIGDDVDKVASQFMVSNFIEKTFKKSKNLLSNDLASFNLDLIRSGTGTSIPMTSNSGNKRNISNKPILLKPSTTYAVSGSIPSLSLFALVSPTKEIKNGSDNGVVNINLTAITGGYKFTTPALPLTPFFVMNFYLSEDLKVLEKPTQIEEGETVTDFEKGEFSINPRTIDNSMIDDMVVNRIPTMEDFQTQNAILTYDEDSGDIKMFNRASNDKPSFLWFNESIKAIEFTLTKLWDTGHTTLICGIGMESGSRTFAAAFFDGNNTPYAAQMTNLLASIPETISLNNGSAMSPPYQPAENPIPRLLAGDRLRYEILPNKVLRWTLTRESVVISQFTYDTKGKWGFPDRIGWNEGLRLGFANRYAFYTKDIISNIRVYDDENKMLTAHRLAKLEQVSFPNAVKKTWLAIGDSITDIDANNGKGYMGFVNRQGRYNLIDKGFSGATLFTLWRDRFTGRVTKDGWANALPDADIITIYAGTNDFDTGFYIPSSDEDMDAAEAPHPRFGTFDKEDADFKDSHTTLGCLRLMIDKCLEEKPSAKIYIIAPWYREKKGSITGGVFDKMLVNSEGRTIYDYADAIEKVAEEYNLPCVNLARESGVNTKNIHIYTYDYLHPNEEGSRLHANIIGKMIEEHY